MFSQKVSINFDTFGHAHITFFHGKKLLSLGKLTKLEGFSLGKLTEMEHFSLGKLTDMEHFSLGKLTRMEHFSLGKLTLNICNLLLFMYIMKK